MRLRIAVGGVWVALLWAGSAGAFDSACAHPDGGDCTAGPDTARSRWRTEHSEHLQLWELTVAGLALPAHLRGDVNLEVFTARAQLNTFAATLPADTERGESGWDVSWIPAPFAEATSAQQRSYAIAEMAQLPDHSYSLWDWASGNETCPIGGPTTALPYTDAVHCHEFSSHMGALNSNHFLPQAGRFFHYYHDLALARARDCAAMRSVLPPEYRRFVEACDQEAFTFEAIGHHYLQDAFSTGHMWQRWGGPDLSDFEGGDQARAAAVLVAITSGMLHGARGVLQSKLGAVTDWADPLCAPADSSLVLLNSAGPRPGRPTYVDGQGESFEGVGDLYLDLFQRYYPRQRDTFLACSRASVLELLARAGLSASGSSSAPSPSDAAFEGYCLAQRANDWSVHWAFGLDSVTANVPGHIGFGEIAGALETTVIATGLGVLGPIAIPVSLELRYRRDVAAIATYMRAVAQSEPGGTGLANGEAGPLLGALPNGAAQYVRNPPASYSDPLPPFDVTFEDRAGVPADQLTENVLARAYHRAHATEWCETMTYADLSALKSDDDDECMICQEFVLRHVRVGEGPDEYDASQEPLCSYLADSPAYVYVEPEDGTAESAAAIFCCDPDDDDDGGAGAGGDGGSGGSSGMGAGGTQPGAGGAHTGSAGTKSGGGTTGSGSGGVGARGGTDGAGTGGDGGASGTGAAGAGGMSGSGGVGAGGAGGGGGQRAGAGGAAASGGRSGSGGMAGSGNGGMAGSGNASGSDGGTADDGSFEDWTVRPPFRRGCNEMNREGCIPFDGTGPSSWPLEPAPGTSASASGDPLFLTFDRFRYGMQGVGEFVLLEDGAGLVIQVRQQPQPSYQRRISSITALATQVGTQRLAFYADESVPLWIDGEPVLLQEKLELPGGGHVVREAKSFEVRWPSGEVLLVRIVGTYAHLDLIYLKTSAAQRGLRGLMGSDDGVPGNDLTLRDGTPLLGRVSRDSLYDLFANSYRITQAESLFDYPPGTSTADFTDVTFPDEIFTEASLPPDEYAAGFTACTEHGVTASGSLESCILDYAIYGDLSAVRGYQGAPAAVQSLSLSAYANDFASGTGAEFSVDKSAQTPSDAAIPLNHFAGPFSNESASLTVSGLEPHRAVTVTYDLYVLGPWGGTGRFTVTGHARELLDTTFSNQSATQSFPGQRTVWSYPARSGAMAIDALSLPEFAVDSVYRMQHVFTHTASFLTMSFATIGVPAGSAFGIDNLEVSTSAPPGWSEEVVGGASLLHGAPGAPELVGCADGQREAFHDVAGHPDIAGCAATWPGTPSLRAPATAAPCGDALGPCTSPTDACAPGWSLCGSNGDASELTQLTHLECRFRHDGRFIAATSPCVTQGTCASSAGDLSNYGCFESGACAEPVCCGECGAQSCGSAVWSTGTFTAAGQSCGAMQASGTTGVLCCRR